MFSNGLYVFEIKSSLEISLFALNVANDERIFSCYDSSLFFLLSCSVETNYFSYYRNKFRSILRPRGDAILRFYVSDDNELIKKFIGWWVHVYSSAIIWNDVALKFRVLDISEIDIPDDVLSFYKIIPLFYTWPRPESWTFASNVLDWWYFDLVKVKGWFL